MELEELYSLLPEGSFSDFNSFTSFVNENGASAFYPLVDSSIYPTEESFTETLKKKDLSKDMDSFGGDGLSDSFTITRDGDFSTIEYDPYENFTTLNPKSEFDKKFTANTKRLASGTKPHNHFFIFGDTKTPQKIKKKPCGVQVVCDAAQVPAI